MELEQIVNAHDKKLAQHDKELDRLNAMTLEMQKSMNEGLARVDESSRFLREQNTRQSEQNAEILRAVLNRNEKSDERNYELKLLDKSNMWKLILGIGASAGAVFAFVLELIKFFGNR
ncbi:MULTISPECIES: hypothetical protein [unclassified Enterococcus]|uniref:hypothetical protein n=1 Tax=unclassified Enterococcus TaxID=2608891 RepID=UPI0015552BCE|nr:MULTISPECIES: hypothetical protein [unclassified Enterococcus]MBS7576016.1 hypothetical protein [Enterococcus sp. MMGLQ5-2]MBS7583249.1 hypothetical protein [Enterococcus sp. MMGLQ5-1]NPD11109.1 hypothetical protein [Enterococcus sp. MMGLQ5-1]NPD35852.1 hypothetical protein [Enterococcus sp. MMGLQ5-2]